MSESPSRPVASFADGVRTVWARELSAYFDSPAAYAYAAAFLLVSSSTFMNRFFLDAVADLGRYFHLLPLLLVAFAPAITMGAWAQEQAQNTLELVLTLPLTVGQLVVGKFLAAAACYLLVLVGSLPLVVMVAWLGAPDPGLLVSGYLGAVLLGGLFLAIGMLASSLTRDQVVAFVAAALLGFVLVFSGHEEVVAVLDGLAPGRQAGTWLRETLSVLPHYEAFVRGLLSLASVAYFGLLTAVFLWLTRASVLRHRR
jgi:ABC-2 type transport system permease protein